MFHWPGAGLGLGTPANLALASPIGRRRFGRTLLESAATGLGLVFLVLAVDRFAFAGASLERIRAIGALPFMRRTGIVLVSSVGEEIFYRLGVSTLVASLTFLALRNRVRRAAGISVWLGILVASVLFGLSHAGNAPNSAHPIVRALTLNGPVAIALGWLYWYRGLEASVAAHLVADAALYLVLPGLL
jgi:membrane protease YdiL (CAAX protease family)